MDRYGLKPGATVRTPDGTVAEILTETQDGHRTGTGYGNATVPTPSHGPRHRVGTVARYLGREPDQPRLPPIAG
jgi:hypothetical protein